MTPHRARPAAAAAAQTLFPERANRDESAFDRWTRARAAALLARLRPQNGALTRQVRQADSLAAEIGMLDDAQLRQRLHQRAPAALARPAQPGAVAEVLALVREAASRSLGLRPYASQLHGAGALLAGTLAEMATGEGKTLTAALAAAIGACGGVPVHVVTVNDYLAGRDAQQMGPLFALLGLRVGSIISGMDLAQRGAAYACDITYCTNKELVFDYLKDRVASADAPTPGQWQLRQLRQLRQADESPLLTGQSVAQPLLLRGLHMAIVDEADSVLIDEARTPLILAAKSGAAEDPAPYAQALALAQALLPGPHFELSRQRRALHLREAGRQALDEACARLPGVWRHARSRETFIEQALRALHLFERDQHYIVTDGAVQIVDEFTGRVLAGRTWEQGLQQLIEIKEGCALSEPARTLARITYQRFFTRYLHLSGMTGTAAEVAAELREVYALEVVKIPLHRPSRRHLAPDRCLHTAADKWRAVADEVRQALARGQPVLVGTRSVLASEALTAVLDAQGIAHHLLNARQDADEAELVAQAGEPGRVTVATNMAGRGTDITLAPGVEPAGGLHVILTEYHESARIDRQLLGRCARQGDRGSAIGLVALDDALLREQGGWLLRMLVRMLVRTPAGGLPGPTLLRWLRWHCQRRASAHSAGIRRHTLNQERRTDATLAFAGQTR